MTAITKNHRWSLSWPGNICLDCFQEDFTEICVAEGCCFEICTDCTEESNRIEQCIWCIGTGLCVVECTNPEHKNGPCLANENK